MVPSSPPLRINTYCILVIDANADSLFDLSLPSAFLPFLSLPFDPPSPPLTPPLPSLSSSIRTLYLNSLTPSPPADQQSDEALAQKTAARFPRPPDPKSIRHQRHGLTQRIQHVSQAHTVLQRMPDAVTRWRRMVRMRSGAALAIDRSRRWPNHNAATASSEKNPC